MYFFGLFLYIALPAYFYSLETGRNFVHQCYALAPEVTALIGVAFVYPVLVFLFSVIMRKKAFATRSYFKSQIILASSMAVSLGLIGTFIGLAQMVAGIAAGMGAEGDFATKMASLLTAIAAAMDAMSLAFLTSILGVAASVIVLLAGNYLESFFPLEITNNANKANGAQADEADSDYDTKLGEGFKGVRDAVQQTLDLVNDKEKMWADLFLLLEKNTGSVIVDQLNHTLNQNNDIMRQMMDTMQAIRVDQAAHFEGNRQAYSLHTNQVQQVFSTHTNQVQQALGSHTTQMQQGFERMITQTQSMGTALDLLRVDGRENSERVVQIIDKNLSELSEVAKILHDLRLALALPLEESLKSAIRGDGFYLIFQPQKNKDGALVGAEAFLRWEDSVRGLIPSNDLFQIAKEHNLLIDVDRWVMKSAVKQLSEWIAEGSWSDQQVLSINVSSEHLLDPRFISYLEDLLADYKVPAHCIAVEVTENVIMANPNEARDKIRQIKALGVKTFIDDFGTGYSSLMSLKTLKIDMLKVDRDIIKDLPSAESLSVLRSIVNMAQELGIELAAEGIETQEQMNVLAEEGCYTFQGYFIGKPERLLNQTLLVSNQVES